MQIASMHVSYTCRQNTVYSRPKGGATQCCTHHTAAQPSHEAAHGGRVRGGGAGAGRRRAPARPAWRGASGRLAACRAAGQRSRTRMTWEQRGAAHQAAAVVAAVLPVYKRCQNVMWTVKAVELVH